MAKKTIEITLYMSELTYEVRNKTYLTGRSRADGDNFKEVAHMQVTDDDAEANQVLRSIGNALSSLKVELGEYLVESGTTATDAQMGADENYVVQLLVPSNYNQSMNDAIATALHQYVVNTAISDWFMITNKGDMADYASLAATSLAQVREAIHKRVRPVR